MNIYRKICVLFSNFNSKLIRGIKFRKKITLINKIVKKNWFLPKKIIGFYHSLKSNEVKDLEPKH